jgi:tetratricopeptide (TPR) repeat protein
MNKILIIFLFITAQIYSQDIDITSALKQIESGNIQSATKTLQEFRFKNMNDPSVIFLDAVLTKDGDEALKKYSIVLEKYPESKYADASLYRIFSYYYTLGYYKKAESYLNRLKKDYPESVYIKTADRKIPDIEEPIIQQVTTPQIKQPVQQKKVESEKYNFTIQAGAFLNLENAKKLSDQLKKENYFTEITTKEVGGSILNVLNVGRFTNEEETKTVLNFLESKFKIKGRVVSINE